MPRRQRTVEPLPTPTSFGRIKEALLLSAVNHGIHVTSEYALDVIEAMNDPESEMYKFVKENEL